MSNYIWYASYGSNLSKERFMCYIQGGTPKGSTKQELGCRDKTPPLEAKRIKLPFELYFSGFSKRWNGSPAFINSQRDGNADTLGYMYLITEEQFIDVIKQENNINDLSLDLEIIKNEKAKTILDSTYGTVLFVGEEGGNPIFTFTETHLDEKRVGKPSVAYLKMLIRGYREVYNLSNDEIFGYLKNKKGVKGYYSNSELINVING